MEKPLGIRIKYSSFPSSLAGKIIFEAQFIIGRGKGSADSFISDPAIRKAITAYNKKFAGTTFTTLKINTMFKDVTEIINKRENLIGKKLGFMKVSFDPITKRAYWFPGELYNPFDLLKNDPATIKLFTGKAIADQLERKFKNALKKAFPELKGFEHASVLSGQRKSQLKRRKENIWFSPYKQTSRGLKSAIRRKRRQVKKH